MFLPSNTQPFLKRLDQNTTFWKKVGPKYNLLEKGCFLKIVYIKDNLHAFVIKRLHGHLKVL
jgi:hypothetical protein